jgi:transcriptional regulator with AAA-type ATPase domain
LGRGRLHLWRDAIHFLERAAQRRNERLLVVGPRGSGRTSLALRAARDYLQTHFKDAARPIVRIDCRALDASQLESEILGEADRVSTRVQLSGFERALGGVLLLDNVEALPASIQRRLKAHFESLDLGLGEARVADTAKVIATVSTDKVEDLEPGFLESLAHREVHIPELGEMPGLEGLVDLLLDEAGVTIDPDGREALLTALTIPAFAPSLRGAKKSLELAVACCRADGRDRLFRQDVVAAFERKTKTSSHAESGMTATDSARSGDHPAASSLSLASLVEMAKSGNVRFETAKELLREILVENAMKRFDGNKKKVAEVLGVSRQTIYEILEG